MEFYLLLLFVIFFFFGQLLSKDYDKEKLIKKIALVILGLLCLCYEVIIIIKLDLSYKIKKDKITWFMKCDYALIVILFLYLVCTIYIIISYYIYAGYDVAGDLVILTKFRDIKINEYLLPDYFANFK